MKPRIRESFSAVELRIIKLNTDTYERLYKIIARKCSIPDCQIPISSNDNEAKSLPWHGFVCSVCYDMYHALNGRAYWIKLNKEWDDENDKRKKDKKRMLDGGGFFN